jgi:cytochrome c peroxidase
MGNMLKTSGKRAKFVRLCDSGVTLAPANPYSPEKAKLGRMLFFDP